MFQGCTTRTRSLSNQFIGVMKLTKARARRQQLLLLHTHDILISVVGEGILLSHRNLCIALVCDHEHKYWPLRSLCRSICVDYECIHLSLHSLCRSSSGDREDKILCPHNRDIQFYGDCARSSCAHYNHDTVIFVLNGYKCSCLHTQDNAP